MENQLSGYNTADLVKKAQNGDMRAFEELVTLYQHKVYMLGCQLTGNPDDAQDLAQEVFVRAYRSLTGFRNEANFGTWLHRITVNTWLNHRKKSSRTETVSLDAPLSTDHGDVQREIAAEGSDPLEAIEAMEFRRQVQQALDQLSSEHRTVLVLREIQGHSYDEIANMLNCTLGTVKSRLNRARLAMKALLPSHQPLRKSPKGKAPRGRSC